MRYEDKMPVVEIAKTLDLDRRSIYGRLKRYEELVCEVVAV